MNWLKVVIIFILAAAGLTLGLAGIFLLAYPRQSNKIAVNAAIVGINGQPNGTCQDRSNHRAVCTLSVTFPLRGTAVNATYDYDGRHNYVSGDTIRLYVNPNDITDISLRQSADTKTIGAVLIVLSLILLLTIGYVMAK